MHSLINGIEFSTQRTTFKIRGLTYGEYMSIIEMNIKTMLRFSYEVCRVGIIDVGIVDEDGFVIDYDPEEHFDLIFDSDPEAIAEVTNKILEMTVVSDNEKDMIKGSIMFSHYLSKNKKAESSWNCQFCVKRGLHKDRKCSKLAEDELADIDNGVLPQSIFPEMTKEERESWRKPKKKDASKPKGVSRRLTLAERKARRKAAMGIKEKPKEQSTYVLRTDYFDYKRCPVSYMDRATSLLTSIAGRSLTFEAPLVDGGIEKQPNKFLEVGALIKAYQHEAFEIDTEKSEAQHKKSASSKKR